MAKFLDSEGLNRVIDRLRTALNRKQDKLNGTEGQIIGFNSEGQPVAQDLPDASISGITCDEIDAITQYVSEDPPEFSCTMTLSGATRFGTNWDEICVLDFYPDGDGYSAEGLMKTNEQAAMLSDCTVSGVPAAKEPGNGLLLSDRVLLIKDGSGVYRFSGDQGDLLGLFGLYGGTTMFTAKFVDSAGQEPASAQNTEEEEG